MIQIWFQYSDALLAGLAVTVQLCGLVWVIGLVAGLLLAFISEVTLPSARIIILFASRLIEAIPVIVLLFWFHYPLQVLMGVVIDPFVTSVILLSIINAFNVSGCIMRSIGSLQKGYIETATTSGATEWALFRYIKAPLAIRDSLGSILSSQVLILHLSIFASLISVEEIFRVAQQINAVAYKPVEIYSALALFFLMICLPLNLVAFLISRKYSYSE